MCMPVTVTELDSDVRLTGVGWSARSTLSTLEPTSDLEPDTDPVSPLSRLG